MEPEHFCQWCERAVSRSGVNWFGHYAMAGGELIHYVEGGTGEPLVLLHGFMCWSYSWRRNLPALARDARVVAPDLRGFGLSERNNRRGHSLSDQVEVLRAFLDAMGISRAIVCGHSMGGEVALRFAMQYPERVRALILVAASGYVSHREGPAQRIAVRLPLLGRLVVRAVVLNRTFASRTLRTAYRRPEQVLDSDIAAYLLPASIPGSSRAFVSMLRDMDFGITAQQIQTVGHKSLIIWGEDDPWLSVEYGRRLAEELADSRLVILPDCGHVPQEEHPELFNATVGKFLRELPSEGPPQSSRPI